MLATGMDVSGWPSCGLPGGTHIRWQNHLVWHCGSSPPSHARPYRSGLHNACSTGICPSSWHGLAKLEGISSTASIFVERKFLSPSEMLIQGLLNDAFGLFSPICAEVCCVQELMHGRGSRMHLQRWFQTNKMPRWVR